MTKYRKAKVGDEREISLLMSKCVDLPWTERQVLEEIESGAPFFVAVDEKTYKIIGFISGAVGGDECELSDVAVDENYRNNGVATKLFGMLFNELKNRSVKKVFLLVRFDNDTARSLYNKLGFTEVGKRKRYYGGADALIMRNDIR